MPVKALAQEAMNDDQGHHSLVTKLVQGGCCQCMLASLLLVFVVDTEPQEKEQSVSLVGETDHDPRIFVARTYPTTRTTSSVGTNYKYNSSAWAQDYASESTEHKIHGN